MDYRTYVFTKKELLENLLLFLLLDGVISYLFFRSIIAFLLLLPAVRWFLQEQKKSFLRRQQEVLSNQFLFSMQAVTASLTAGFSIETAFEDALKELENLYREDDLIMVEMRFIVSNLKMNRNIEELLLDLSDRSGIEDIRNFAELFAVSKRTGGNLIAIIRNTSVTIGKKEETRKEIQTILSAKKMEQNIMSAIPCLILLYIQTVSPGFLDGMYHNPTGIAIMGSCLLIYGAAFLWGKKIVEIEV